MGGALRRYRENLGYTLGDAARVLECDPSKVSRIESGQQPEAPPAPAVPPVLPGSLLAQARELDAEHRAATGRPISRDALRAQLRIGRDRASALTAAVRRCPH